MFEQRAVATIHLNHTTWNNFRYRTKSHGEFSKHFICDSNYVWYNL